MWLLTHVNSDVRIPVADDALDAPRLRPVQLDMVPVGIKITGQLALEVRNTVDIVSRQDLDVHLLQKGCRPLLVRVHLSQECEHGLVCRGLVAVNRGLEIDSQFVRLVGPRQ